MTTFDLPPAPARHPSTALEKTPALAGTISGFTRFGAPHRVLSGSLHYFRVHPDLWSDRLARLAALGLNTVDTYVPWNFHERKQGERDFSGWRDVGRFIDLAAATGLDVIVRPGPYICAEWDNGGLPSWVTRGHIGTVRSSHPDFLRMVEEWFDLLLPILESRQACHGGPVVAVQVENEYGSYGDDGEYMAWVRKALVERGITELLYTADGPTPLMLDGGGLADTLMTATFGSGATEAVDLLRARRPRDPFFCAEFWNGWFDHWGEMHNIRDAADAAANVKEILDAGGSVSLYMAHGGTNFGLWSGANHDGRRFQPTVTSYDSDAPIAENGALTPKFQAIRKVLTGTDTEPFDTRSLAPIRTLPSTSLAVETSVDLLSALRNVGQATNSPSPLSFEALELDAGLMLYRSQPVLPPGEVTVSLVGLRDRAQLFVDGVPVGIIDRNDERQSIVVHGEGRKVLLEVLVENQGRINYGHRLGEGKGIGAVLVDRRMVHHWEHLPLPLADLDPGALIGPGGAGAGAGVRAGIGRAVLDVEVTADAFLALPGFGKGFVWINGFLLGRYWEVGPQKTLYIPAPLLRVGANELVMLELEKFGTHLEIRDTADLGPAKDYVESF